MDELRKRQLDIVGAGSNSVVTIKIKNDWRQTLSAYRQLSIVGTIAPCSRWIARASSEISPPTVAFQ